MNILFFFFLISFLLCDQVLLDKTAIVHPLTTVISQAQISIKKEVTESYNH